MSAGGGDLSQDPGSSFWIPCRGHTEEGENAAVEGLLPRPMTSGAGATSAIQAWHQNGLTFCRGLVKDDLGQATGDSQADLGQATGDSQAD